MTEPSAQKTSIDNSPMRMVAAAPAPLVVTLNEAARMIGLCVKVTREKFDKGEIRAYREGKVWRVRVAELNAYITRREKGRLKDPKLPERNSGGKFVAGGPAPLLEQ